MKHGQAIIDLWAAMKKAGVKANGNPKLAISRADSKRCRFEKLRNKGGQFYYLNPDRRLRWDDWKEDIRIPEGTFRGWHEKVTEHNGRNAQGQIVTWENREIEERNIETIVPIIPAKFLNTLRGNLRNYHILWEVKKWKPVPPLDPILLRQLTPNMFVVLATWDLSPLERAVIKGRL